MLERYPTAFGQLLIVLDFLTSSPPEVYVVGERDDPRVAAELRRLQDQWPPSRVFTLVEPALASVGAIFVDAVVIMGALEAWFPLLGILIVAGAAFLLALVGGWIGEVVQARFRARTV